MCPITVGTDHPNLNPTVFCFSPLSLPLGTVGWMTAPGRHSGTQDPSSSRSSEPAPPRQRWRGPVGRRARRRHGRWGTQPRQAAREAGQCLWPGAWEDAGMELGYKDRYKSVEPAQHGAGTVYETEGKLTSGPCICSEEPETHGAAQGSRSHDGQAQRSSLRESMPLAGLSR